MRNRTKHHTIIVIAAILLILMPVANGIADVLQPPQQVIQGVSDKIQTRLKDQNFAKDFPQVTRFVNDVIYPHADFDKIAPLVLGKHWKTATAAEKSRFTHEFQILLVRIYSRAFVEYKNWSIRFLPLEMPGDATKVIVKTKVLQPGINPVDVNYRMFLSKGEWKLYDFMIDGVSMVTNYRTTFNDQIQRKGSLNALIEDLAKRNVDALAAKGS